MSMCKKSYPKCLRFLEPQATNTKKSYEQSIGKYEKFHGKTIEELVDEALDEQTNRVPHHQLKVIDRIEDFQKELCKQGLVLGTVQLHTSRIKTIYKRNRVELPYITPLNPKQVKRREYIEFKDVLTKAEIKEAVGYMSPIAKARALTIAQGGLSNEECEHLTTSAFINDLKPYHQKDDMVEALKWLSDEDNPVIWVTRLIRWKTKKPYYALIGAEAVNHLARAKLYEMGLNSYDPNSDKLIKTTKKAFMDACRTVNNKLGFGRVAEESKLRSHNLRRFHATYIQGGALTYEEHSLISNSEIDEMQGRGKTTTQDTYIKTNPLRQKVLYAKVMNNLSLWHEYDYSLTKDDVIIRVRDQARENQSLKEEVKQLKSQVDKRNNASKKLDKLKKEMGEDAFNEMIISILES